MKRTSLLLIPILLIALLLCSCNADAQDGIFSAIADSAPDAGIKVQAYLGLYDGHHYILTDSGITVLGDSDGFEQILSTSDAQIRYACLSINGSSNFIYVVTSKQGSERGEDSKLVRYNTNGVLVSPQSTQTNVKWLTNNGVYYVETSTTKTLKFLTATQDIDFTDNGIINKLESENYVLTEHKDGTLKVYYVYGLNNAEKLSISRSSVSGEIVGFQVVDDSNFLVVINSGSSYGIYTLDSSGLSSSAVTALKSTPANGNICSFYYKDEDGKGHVAFKAANYFDLLTIDGTSYSIDTINTAGYASKLRTALVSNIVSSNNAGKFIIATWNNSIWEIDPTSTDDPVEIK